MGRNNMLAKTSAFDTFRGLGYDRLVPVVPPDAEVSEFSSYASSVGKPNDPRGKAPGIKDGNGKWKGLGGWQKMDVTDEDCARWAAMGASVGIRTGDGLYAIDADTLDEAHAATIRAAVVRHFGDLPTRIGNAPKALYPIRVSQPIPYKHVTFGDGEQCEILGNGKQFVAAGVHPKTGKEYEWVGGPVPLDALPVVTPEQLDAFLEDIAAKLPNAKRTRDGAASDKPVSQDALRGDIEHVRRAVAAIPNAKPHITCYDDYIQMGYAIRAALPDDEPEAKDLYLEWAGRWQDGEPNLEKTEDSWRGMGTAEGDYRVGAPWLYDMAEKAGNFSVAEVYFEPIAEKEQDPFDAQMQSERETAPTDTYPLLTIHDITTREPPKFLIDRHIPETSVGFLYAAPGVGKSFLAMDIGLSIAHGFTDWHGEAMTLPSNAATLYIAAEGSFDLRNRILAWHKARGIDPHPGRFFVIEQTIRFTRPDDIERLRRTVRQAGLKLAFVVVDTVSRALPGVDENSQEDMTIFVEACAMVQREFGCSVMGVHHTNKSGDMRGSTVLRGAGDYVIRMERKRGSGVARIEMEKQKAAEDGWGYDLTLDRIDLDDGQSSLVVDRPVVLTGGAVPGGGGGDRGILAAIQKAWDDGEPWSVAGNAKLERRASRRLNVDFGLDAGAAEEKLTAWMARGWIVNETLSARTRTKGLKVGVGAMEALAAMSEGRNDVDPAVHFEPVGADETSQNSVNLEAFG